jgi:hypothetical protein
MVEADTGEAGKRRMDESVGRDLFSKNRKALSPRSFPLIAPRAEVAALAQRSTALEGNRRGDHCYPDGEPHQGLKSIDKD